MKKLLTLLLTLIICTASLFADGVMIGDLYYLLDKKSLTAQVTYKSYDQKAKKYNADWDIQTANVPESVTYKKKTYRVTSIGNYAFYNCSKLTSVTIGNSVTSIGVGAFTNCPNLTSVTIGNNVTSIGNYAFQGCSSLKSVSMGDGVQSIGISAFRGCSGLTSITIPNNVTNIDTQAFFNCSGLTSVTIPNSVRNIGNSAFYGCKGLTSVILGNSVTDIGEDAFSNCSALTSFTMGNSVRTIGKDAFEKCYKLKELHISDLAAWCRISFNYFTSNPLDYAHHIYLDGSEIKDLVIPNGIASIGKYAFMGCYGLTSVTIPNSVKTIEEWAFYGCGCLASVSIPNSVAKIDYGAFSNCKNLSMIIIPNSVKSVKTTTFDDCPNLSIYTTSKSVYESLNSKYRRHLLSQEELNKLAKYYNPFSVFAKDYVERNINEWQKKGEFERVTDWQQRVTEKSRQQKIKSLITEARNEYTKFHAEKLNLVLALGKYDAENEVFAMKEDKYGTLYISVPLKEAENFKNNWDAKTVKPKMQIYDDEAKLSALTIAMPNGKQYTYRNTDAVSYNLTEMTYNFEPVQLDLPKTSSAPKQGQVNITKTTLKADKSAVDTNIPETKASNPNTFAVIFANEDYKNVASVPFAKNDGAVFRKYCQKTLGIPADNIHYVENATLNDMGYQLAWLKKVCDAFEGKASLIVYYAGHGIPDEASKSAYLLPVDGYGSYVQSAYKLDDMYQKLGAMNAKSVTVFMDACFSGSKREEGMLASARGVAIKVKSGEPQGKMVVFSAASGDETAYPNNDEQHGMFTYFLLKKLQETKGDVTLQDLGDYITTNVRQQSIVKNGKSQTPCVTPSASLSTNWKNWKLK